MVSAPKRENREKKLPVKKEMGGESTAKPVFQIKTLEKKKEKTFSGRAQKPKTKRNQNQDQI